MTTTDTAIETTPENDSPRPEDPATSWLVIFCTYGTLATLPMPPVGATPDQWAATFAALNGRVDMSAGIMSMSRGLDGLDGHVNLYPSKDGAATPAQIRGVRPFIRSRWSARIVRWGDVRFEEGTAIFDVAPHEPAIVRLGPAVGDELAKSCAGRPVYRVRPRARTSARR